MSSFDGTQEARKSKKKAAVSFIVVKNVRVIKKTRTISNEVVDPLEQGRRKRRRKKSPLIQARWDRLSNTGRRQLDRTSHSAQLGTGPLLPNKTVNRHGQRNRNLQTGSWGLPCPLMLAGVVKIVPCSSNIQNGRDQTISL